MTMSLYFGWQTAVLCVPSAILLTIAFCLTRVLHNRTAARTLAAVLVVLVGVITPWMIGFAGFYDTWPWLTFLPVAIPLWVPAFLWLFVHSIIEGRWPDNWKVVLLPGSIQFLYLFTGFLLPLDMKTAWVSASEATASFAFNVMLIAYFLIQTRLSLRLMDRYRRALAGVRSDDALFTMNWLSRFIGAFSALWVLWSVISVWDFLKPWGYDGLMILYLLIAAFGLYLAIEGWRHSGLAFPTLGSLLSQSADEELPARDWRAQAETWAIRVRESGLAYEPEFNVQRLARHLGTNTTYVSRALNEGLGVNFSTFINQLRCEHVANRLKEGASDDILTLALEAGFSSKASFNRAFCATIGMSPTAYRAMVSKPK